ncbi:MAG: deoxyhypusine synthase [Nitrososphaeria archaeon]
MLEIKLKKDDREKLLRIPIKDPSIEEVRSLGDFVRLYEQIWGFSAADLVRASEIIANMVKDKSCVKFFSFTGNLVSTGFRGFIKDIIREGFVDVIITTCGSIDHDIARTAGGGYFRGTFDIDDRYLEELQIHRLGNVFIPLENYGPIVEKVVYRTLSKLDKERHYGIREILDLIGDELGNEDSFIYCARKRNVPIYVPGFLDGAFGTAMFTYSTTNNILIDPFKDQRELADIVFKTKKSGAIIVGGGISKHHTIWWNQFKEGLDYAVYISTAQEFDGSLSGARPREAITWGKIKPQAEYCFVNGDATIIFPLLLIMVKSLISI